MYKLYTKLFCLRKPYLNPGSSKQDINTKADGHLSIDSGKHA